MQRLAYIGVMCLFLLGISLSMPMANPNIKIVNDSPAPSKIEVYKFTDQCHIQKVFFKKRLIGGVSYPAHVIYFCVCKKEQTCNMTSIPVKNFL